MNIVGYLISFYEMFAGWHKIRLLRLGVPVSVLGKNIFYNVYHRTGSKLYSNQFHDRTLSTL